MSNSKKNAQNPDCERGCSEKNRDESFLDYIKNQIVMYVGKEDYETENDIFRIALHNAYLYRGVMHHQSWISLFQILISTTVKIIQNVRSTEMEKIH